MLKLKVMKIYGRTNRPIVVIFAVDIAIIILKKWSGGRLHVIL